jgi:hypothetical protein
VAALWPQRCKALVSVSGYTSSNCSVVMSRVELGDLARRVADQNVEAAEPFRRVGR